MRQTRTTRTRPTPEGERSHPIAAALTVLAIAATLWVLLFAAHDCARRAVESAKPKAGPLSDETGEGPAPFASAPRLGLDGGDVVRCDGEGCDECFGPSYDCLHACDLPGAECIDVAGAWKLAADCSTCEAPWYPSPWHSHFEGCQICERTRRLRLW